MEPFLFGAELVPAQFIGRKKDVQSILANLDMGGARVCIAEPRRAGKTWFVKRVLRDAASKHKIPCVYLDISGMQTASKFCEKWIDGLCRALSGKKAFKETLALMRKHFSKLNPVGTDSGEIRFEWRPTSTEAMGAFEMVLDVTEQLCEEAPKGKIAVALDEFHEIGQLLGGRANENRIAAEKIIRARIQHQRHVSYIFSGSKKTVLTRMFLDETRPFYKSASLMRLSPISADEWRPYIEDTFRMAGFQIAPEASDEIVKITDGHPYYTQFLCRELWILGIVEKSRRITAETTRKCKSKMIRDLHDPFFRDWNDLTIQQRIFLTNIAEWGGAGIFTMDFMRGSGLSSGQIQACRLSMVDGGILDEDEEKVVFTDPYFKFWILEYNRIGGVDSYPVS